MTKIIALSIFLAVAGCASVPIVQPTATPEVQPTMIPVATEQLWLNDNPDLEFGGCQTVMFETEQWGREVIQQCWPDDYAVYQHVLRNPIRMPYTGTDYSMRPMDNNGSIGLTLSAMTLPPGTYIIKVYGFSDVWGPDTYTIQAHVEIEGEPGRAYLGAHELSANGPYRAMFTLNALQFGTYRVSVYLRLTHPDMTAGSYLTINRITVEVAPE